MKPFLCRIGKRDARGGFSLVEATLSIGLLSFGFLTLVPLMAIGLKTARVAHTNRDTAQIAQSLVEEARQGTLASGTTYLDFQGNATGATTAAYAAQSTLQAVSGNATLTRLTLRVTPVGAPDRARTYAVVFSAPQ
jgi:uncharacterized protein (TIGR02598 family)